ncbi:hypothetical protein PV327_008143 [Microctonus hyperodae]|uniref:BTB domain-containing protein n=1 Tax=Microctonus hyperodae TaxID=165561 RepID=A0AA39KGL7_MICHY|nr:hypothetical protein PV327_008143 [Microctonus hyperodae]
MFQPDIQITHSWYLKYSYEERTVEAYSGYFQDKLLPDVKFTLFCSVLDSSKCRVIISTIPCRRPNAMVRIVLEARERKNDDVYNNGWDDCCTFIRDIHIYDPRCCWNCKGDSGHFVTCFNFKCYITWRGFNELQQSVNCDLYSHLKNFLTVPDFSDTIIVIDEKEILVHKIILAAYSPVFLTMFKSGMTESSNNRIIVTDIEIEIMEKVVEFMYTGTINPIPEYDVLLSIMKVADKYEINNLKILCEQKLSEKMTIKNVFEILEKNSLYGGPLLATNVVYFMIKNKLSIIKSKDFEDFHSRKPELLSQFFIHSIVDANNANK